MTDETPLNTSLGEKLREILQALSTREGQDELKKLTESLESVKIKEKGSDHEKHYVHIGGGGGEDKGSKVPYSSTLSINSVETWEKQLLSEPKARLIRPLSANEAKNILTQRSTVIADTQKFNTKIKLEGSPVTNQKSSGRCWLFAATNVFRVAIMKRYNLKDFQLSQSYLFFWDKLEKANYFLEQIIDTADEDLEGRLIQTLLAAPVQDGGQWDMVANLVEKYGLVPHELYPDSFNATSSRTMGSLITTKLREYALELRSLMSKGSSTEESRMNALGSAKVRMMKEIQGILVLMLGPPPSPSDNMTWEYYNANDEFCSLSITPTTFAAELSSRSGIQAMGGTDIHEVFSLVNDPRNAYGEHLSVSRLGNVVGMRDVRYVNVDMDTMKKTCIAMLEADIPIFFGSDVGKFSDKQSGIMDTDLIDYELGFNVTLGMSKAQRLRTSESAMTHAMVLTAVHVIDGKPVRWRVQNSWGETAGTKGWFVMSDKWMDEFVYQVVVDPRFVSQEIRDVLKKEPKMLPLWDPMGALA